MKNTFRILLTGLTCLIYVYSNAQQTTLERLYTNDLMWNEEVAPNDYAGSFNKPYMVNTVNAMIGTFGDAEMVIMKTDTGGNLLQHKILGKPMYHDICTEVAFKNDHFYFTGNTRGIDTSASPLFTSFIIQTDEQLNIIRETNYILPNADFFLETFTAGNGNYLLSSGKYYDFNTSEWYLFIMKTDTTGNITWINNPFKTPFLGTDIKKIHELPNGDIVLLGSVTIGFEQSLSTIMLFNNTGDFKWARLYNYDVVPPQNSTLLFGKLMPDGNLIACGRTDYGGPGNLGQMDYQMIKIDTADGNLIWSRAFGGSQIDWLYGASYDQSTGKFIMLGNSASFYNPSFSAFYGGFAMVDTGGMVTQSFIQGDTANSSYNLFLANYSKLSTGNIMIGGSKFMDNLKFSLTRHFPSISTTGGCDYYQVAFSNLPYLYPTYSYTITTNSPITLQTNQLLLDQTQTYINDTVLCYQNPPPPSTSIEETGNQWEVKIYPNPSTNYFEIDLSQTEEPGPYSLSICDSKGNVLSEHVYHLENKTTKIYHTLSAGIYFLKISGPDRVSIKKLLITI